MAYWIDYQDKKTIYFQIGKDGDRLGSLEEAITKLREYSKVFLTKEGTARGIIGKKERSLETLKEYKIYYKGKELIMEIIKE